jgi:hypothetical protein
MHEHELGGVGGYTLWVHVAVACSKLGPNRRR